MPRTRLRAILYLILVFASGVLVGVASTRLYAVKASVPTPAAPRTMAEFTRRYTDEMRQQIGVNDQQVAAVEKILADSKKRYDDLRREQRPMRDRIQQEQVDSIRAVLTDAQKPAYEAWRAERLKRSKTGASGASGSSGAAK